MFPFPSWLKMFRCCTCLPTNKIKCFSWSFPWIQQFDHINFLWLNVHPFISQIRPLSTRRPQLLFGNLSTPPSPGATNCTDISEILIDKNEGDVSTPDSSTMIASFVNPELIGELNDRDNACTSPSHGFVWAKDYSESMHLWGFETWNLLGFFIDWDSELMKPNNTYCFIRKWLTIELVVYLAYMSFSMVKFLSYFLVIT